jgi:hypothetical protein
MINQASSSSIILFGGALAIAALWVLTSLAVNWDARQRSLSASQRKMWVAITVLLPLFGFALYLTFRVFKGYFSFSQQKLSEEEAARRTAVKPTQASMVMPEAQPRKAHERYLQPAWSANVPAGPNGKNHAPFGEHSTVTVAPAQPPSTPDYVFSVTGGPDRGQRFVLQQFPALIGRGAEVAISLERDLNVSRKHAELVEVGGILRIRDLQSMHGTLVNGILIREKVLNPGDEIRIGSTTLLLGEIGQNWDGSFSR